MNTHLLINAIHPRTALIVALGLGSVSAEFLQQNPNELKQRVLAQAQSVSPDDYAFTRTIRTEQISSGKTEKKASVERFDPAKPAVAKQR